MTRAAVHAPVSGSPERVSMFVMAYNQEDYVEDAVRSAFAQTYSPLEIILSDNCYTDRTDEIMERLAAEYDGPHEVRVTRNPRNLGFIEPWESGRPAAGTGSFCKSSARSNSRRPMTI